MIDQSVSEWINSEMGGLLGRLNFWNGIAVK